MTPLVPVLLAGGEGRRLASLGEGGVSKPFHPLLATGGLTLFQQTLRRALLIAPSEQCVVVTSSRMAELARAQAKAVGAPRVHLLAEPASRNTAAAVTLAALYAEHRWRTPTLAVLPCDHYIQDETLWAEDILRASARAQDGRIAVFGIAPKEASDRFGYIAAGGTSFYEKPSLEEARALTQSGALVNSGMFVMRASTCLQELQRHAPALLAGVKAAWTPQAGAIEESLYAATPSLPVDKAIMEHTALLTCVKLSTGWADLGTWDEVERVLGVRCPVTA